MTRYAMVKTDSLKEARQALSDMRLSLDCMYMQIEGRAEQCTICGKPIDVIKRDNDRGHDANCPVRDLHTIVRLASVACANIASGNMPKSIDLAVGGDIDEWSGLG